MILNECKRHMKTATLIGYHGRKNLGDDIFREITLRWLATALGVSTCYITAHKGTVEASTAGITLRTVESPVSGIARLLWLPVFLRALRSDFLVFSAGSIFTIQPFLLMFLTLRLLKLFRGKRLRILAVGVSIGPFKNRFDRYWCLKSLALMERIMLRDLKSIKLIEAPGHCFAAELSYDLALCWDRLVPEQVVQKVPGLIGLALTARGYGRCTGGHHSGNCNSIVASIGEFLDQNESTRVRVLCVCSDEVDGDVRLSRHIADRFAKWRDRIDIVVYDRQGIEHFLALIRQCSLVIASRMHAGIMAMNASIPVYQISYAEKITSFFEHCGLSTTYLYTHDQVTTESLTTFLRKGLSNELESFSSAQSASLLKKGDIVYSDLLRLLPSSPTGWTESKAGVRIAES